MTPALADTFARGAATALSIAGAQSVELTQEMAVAENLEPNVWLERCARRISEVEADIADTDARRIARDLQRFERTAAMPPEAAVDFVAIEMSKPQRAPFERRRADRG